MNAELKLIVLTDGTILISQIEEVPSELGEPDCRLLHPFVVNKIKDFDYTISPWLLSYTSQNTYMIHSDKILTIADPDDKLIEKYNSILK